MEDKEVELEKEEERERGSRHCRLLDSVMVVCSHL